MSKILGIDLGTTNSCMAVMDAGEPLVLENSSQMKQGDPVYALSDSGGDSPSNIFKDGKLLAVNALESNRIIFHVGLSSAPKESGGPVFNNQGRVIGMLFARKDIQNIFRRMKPVPENTSFAIKSSYLQQTLDKVSKTGEKKIGLPNDSLSALTGAVRNGTVTIEVSP